MQTNYFARARAAGGPNANYAIVFQPFDTATVTRDIGHTAERCDVANAADGVCTAKTRFETGKRERFDSATGGQFGSKIKTAGRSDQQASVPVFTDGINDVARKFRNGIPASRLRVVNKQPAVGAHQYLTV